MIDLGFDPTTGNVKVLQIAWQGNCYAVATAAVVIYDHVITISSELEFIWNQRYSYVTILFHLNRWLVFADVVVYIFRNFLRSDAIVCNAIYFTYTTMTILLNFLWTAFSALRTYGLCGGWWLTGLVGILSSAQVLTNLYGFFFARYSRMHDLPVLGAVCIGESDLIPTTASKLALSSRICTIIADVIILAHIWQKTYFLKKDVCRGCRLSQLEVILQRDGAVYFLAILILNALQIVLLRIELYYLTSALSSVIISRFLLNIREAAYAPIDDFNSLSFSSHSRFPSLRFETPGSSIAEQPSTVTQLTDVEMSWDDGDHERGNVGSDVTVRRIIRDSEGTTRELRVMKQ